MKKLVIILMVLAAATAMAQPPRTMNFQGTLADGSGVVLPDGNYNLTFRLWNSDVGGVQLWTETIAVNQSSGIFNTILGETTPMLLPFDQPYFLGIAVGADPELSPRSPLTGMPYAMNVADGAVVKSLNGRVDHLNVVGGANITVQVVGNDIIINGTGALTDNDWNVVGNNMTSIPVGNVGIGINPPGTKLDVAGDIRAGDGVTAGSLFARVGAGTQASSFGGAHGSYGSQISLLTDDGSLSFQIQPDVGGTGGFLGVRRNGLSNGFAVDGNFGATESPRVDITGTSSSMSFRTDLTGDGSVVFPGDAVAAAEIFDEPGVASAIAGGPISPTTTNAALVSRTIVCPTAGYVYVQATCEVDINHVTGTTSFATLGVSELPTILPGNQDLSPYLPSTSPSGIRLIPCSPSGIFPVSAGSNTFYLVGRKNSAAVDIQIWDMQLNCIFFATNYGTVTPTVADGKDVDQFSGEVPAVSAMTAGDIATEQVASEAADRERVNRELDAMRRQLEDLQKNMDRLNSVADAR